MTSKEAAVGLEQTKEISCYFHQDADPAPLKEMIHQEQNL